MPPTVEDVITPPKKPHIKAFLSTTAKARFDALHDKRGVVPGPYVTALALKALELEERGVSAIGVLERELKGIAV